MKYLRPACDFALHSDIWPNPASSLSSYPIERLEGEEKNKKKLLT